MIYDTGRVRRHFDLKHARATGHGVVDEEKVLDALSPRLRREVHAVRAARLVAGAPLLNGTLARRSVALAVAPLLEPLAAAMGEAVIERDEPGAELYFIDDGAVRLYRDDVAVAVMEAGSYFGELPIIFETILLQPFAAVACEPCELWILGRGDFEDVAELYPEMPRIMGLIARQRLVRMRIAFADLENDDVRHRVRMLATPLFAESPRPHETPRPNESSRHPLFAESPRPHETPRPNETP